MAVASATDIFGHLRTTGNLRTFHYGALEGAEEAHRVRSGGAVDVAQDAVSVDGDPTMSCCTILLGIHGAYVRTSIGVSAGHRGVRVALDGAIATVGGMGMLHITF